MIYLKAAIVTFTEQSSNSTALKASVNKGKKPQYGKSKQLNNGEKKENEKHRNKDVERLFGINLVLVSVQITGTIMEVDKC